MTFLLLIPAFLVIAFYVLVIALCRSAGDADRRLERMRRTDGGWRS